MNEGNHLGSFLLSLVVVVDALKVETGYDLLRRVGTSMAYGPVKRRIKKQLLSNTQTHDQSLNMKNKNWFKVLHIWFLRHLIVTFQPRYE